MTGRKRIERLWNPKKEGRDPNSNWKVPIFFVDIGKKNFSELFYFSDLQSSFQWGLARIFNKIWPMDGHRDRYCRISASWNFFPIVQKFFFRPKFWWKFTKFTKFSNLEAKINQKFRKNWSGGNGKNFYENFSRFSFKFFANEKKEKKILTKFFLFFE